MSASVVALLPNAGLANKLFVWAKAQVFGHVNGLPVSAVGWSWPKIGPWLRGERSMRMYARYFERTSFAALLALARGRMRGTLAREPGYARLDAIDPRAVYVFDAMPEWADLFADLREHRDFLRARLFAAVRREHIATLDALPAPVVALHVRRGDFRAMRPGEQFEKSGGVRTPDTYFNDIVAGLRGAAGSNVPITVFSDGTDAELAFLLDLPDVTRSTAPNDVVDLLLMSRARVIVTSAGSTFSEWAGFVSDAALIRHPRHIRGRIRPASPGDHLHEGPPPDNAEGWSLLWRDTIAPLIERSRDARASA